MSEKKVALYHPWIHTKGGGIRMILEILKRSKHDINLYTNHYDKDKTYSELENFDINTLGDIPLKGEIFRGISFALTSLFSKIDLSKYDVLLVSTAGIGEFILFRNHSVPVLGFCHTPLRAAHDEEYYETKIKEKNLVWRFFYSFGSKIYTFFERRAWKYFDEVIANSENTKERILKADLKEEESLSVLHPGVDIDKFEEGDFEKYFFCPSRFKPYKRQDLAIEAFEEFFKNNDDFKLILCGSSDNEEYLEKLREMSEDNDNIEIKVNVSEEELLELYKNCYSLLFLARNEDWGMVPLEGMASGKPVIAVDEGGPRESINDGETGFLVDSNPKDIAEKMERITHNNKLAQKLGREGKKQAEKYSWKSFVKRIDGKIESR